MYELVFFTSSYTSYYQGYNVELGFRWIVTCASVFPSALASVLPCLFAALVSSTLCYGHARSQITARTLRNIYHDEVYLCPPPRLRRFGFGLRPCPAGWCVSIGSAMHNLWRTLMTPSLWCLLAVNCFMNMRD